MSTVGVVYPAYHPDMDLFTAYLSAVADLLSPAVVRVELDDPRPGTVDALHDLPFPVEVNAVAARRGKGAAITAGFEALAPRVDVLAFADADGSTPADSLADVVRPVSAGRADLAVGSRRHPDAEIVSHQTLARRRLGDGFAWLARRLLDVALYDYQCGAKALSAETWAAVREHLYEPGFAWDIELVSVADALDRTVVEVPVVWEDHPQSTVSTLGTTLDLGRALVRSRHRARSLREDRLHALIDRSRESGPSLIERLGADPVDE
ncbi:glycosyltransferase [Salinigranum marinum]|uniref:glycosyltransferase n=1 Tax=Salinigranum marinum TaxID=1515595 RepID=UPI002989CF30|nr:glycosyltransferase [Salinigranum marinum]